MRLRPARDAQMKNTCSTEGLGRDLLSPRVALCFLSVPSCRRLQDQADSPMHSSPVDPIWVFPRSTADSAAPERLQGGVDSAMLMDSTEDEDGVAPQT